MIASFDHCAMEAPTPKGAASALAHVVVICELALELLHEATKVIGTVAHCEEVYVVASNTKIEESNLMLANSIS